MKIYGYKNSFRAKHSLIDVYIGKLIKIHFQERMIREHKNIKLTKIQTEKFPPE